LRVNDRVRRSPVRLIGPEGEQLGILPVNEALDRAHEYGLDLVEVSPNAKPAVCRILDYGRYKYELSKKDKAAKKKQHSFQLKEMRYRPKIDEHDFEFKTKHVRSFLEAGSKVKAFVMFRGREMAYTERGRMVLDRVAETLEDVATVEMPPRQDGRHMIMVMAPRPELVRKLKEEQAAKENAAKKKGGPPNEKKSEEIQEEAATTSGDSDS
jgi:translation initiation factor IF-3